MLSNATTDFLFDCGGGRRDSDCGDGEAARFVDGGGGGVLPDSDGGEGEDPLGPALHRQSLHLTLHFIPVTKAWNTWKQRLITKRMICVSNWDGLASDIFLYSMGYILNQECLTSNRSFRAASLRPPTCIARASGVPRFISCSGIGLSS